MARPLRLLLLGLALAHAAADFYRVLGVARDASKRDISVAFRKLSLRWHPDKNVDARDEAERRMRELSEAYAVLSDVDQRRIYDARGEHGGTSVRWEYSSSGSSPGTTSSQWPQAEQGETHYSFASSGPTQDEQEENTSGQQQQAEPRQTYYFCSGGQCEQRAKEPPQEQPSSQWQQQSQEHYYTLRQDAPGAPPRDQRMHASPWMRRPSSGRARRRSPYQRETENDTAVPDHRETENDTALPDQRLEETSTPASDSPPSDTMWMCLGTVSACVVAALLWTCLAAGSHAKGGVGTPCTPTRAEAVMSAMPAVTSARAQPGHLSSPARPTFTRSASPVRYVPATPPTRHHAYTSPSIFQQGPSTSIHATTSNVMGRGQATGLYHKMPTAVPIR